MLQSRQQDSGQLYLLQIYWDKLHVLNRWGQYDQ